MKLSRTFAATALACAFAALPAKAEYNLELAATFPVNGFVQAVTIADFDGDGRDDVVASGRDFDLGPTLLVLLQRTDGTLAEPVLYQTNGGGRAVALGQLDRDARLEVVSEILSDTRAGIAIVDHDVSRGTPVAHHRTYENKDFRNAYRIELFDVDRDGAIDVVTKPVASDVYIYFGDGGGGIRKITRIPLSISNAVDAASGDFNGDGFRDLVVLSSVLRAYVYPNNGTEGFGPRSVINPNPAGASLYPAVVGGDFTGDGRDDLVMTTDFGQLGLYAQDNAGNLTLAQTLATDWSVNRLRGHDVDLDGKLDLIASRGAIGLFVQRDGGLEPERLLDAGAGVDAGIGMGDINGDGCPDLVAYQDGNSLLGVMHGTGCDATADLALDASLATDHAALALANLGDAIAEAPEVQATLVASTGALSLGPLPAGCESSNVTPREASVSCSLADLALEGLSMLSIPYAWTGTDRRNVISLSASANTLTPETALGNNNDRDVLRRAALPPRK